MNNLKHVRRLCGLTQFELAVKAGLHPTAIAQLESGRRKNPRTRTAQAIAAALGVSIDEIWPPEQPPAACGYQL